MNRPVYIYSVSALFDSHYYTRIKWGCVIFYIRLYVLYTYKNKKGSIPLEPAEHYYTGRFTNHKTLILCAYITPFVPYNNIFTRILIL